MKQIPYSGRFNYKRLLPEGRAAVIAHRTIRVGSTKVRVPILHFRNRSDLLKFQRNVSKLDLEFATATAGFGAIGLMTSFNQSLYGKPDVNLRYGGVPIVKRELRRDIRKEKQAIRNLDRGLHKDAARVIRPIKRQLIRLLRKR